MVRIKKEPLMVRVLSTADSLENRASRRQIKNIRTSTPLATKKWTLGRLAERKSILQNQYDRLPKDLKKQSGHGKTIALIAQKMSALRW